MTNAEPPPPSRAGGARTATSAPPDLSRIPRGARLTAGSIALAALVAGPPARAGEGDPPVVPPPPPASGTTAPAHGTMRLPEVSQSVAQRPYTSFMGSPNVSVETVGLYGFGDDTFRFRPTAIFRFGPLILGLGAVVAKETEFNVHFEAISFQSSGWDLAFGFGLADGGTLRFGVPFLEGFRARVMMAFDGGFVAGLGVEAAPW